jgi:hypothetical protein
MTTSAASKRRNLMANKPRKISISFPKDRLHVWMQLEEHCEETDESNRSAVIISLIEKALTPPTPDDDNLTGLYELERISHQVEEVHQQIEELTQLVMAHDEDANEREESPDDTTRELADDDDDEEAVDQQDEPDTGQDTSQDNLAPEASETPPRQIRVWSATKNDWEWVVYEG